MINPLLGHTRRQEVAGATMLVHQPRLIGLGKAVLAQGLLRWRFLLHVVRMIGHADHYVLLAF